MERLFLVFGVLILLLTGCATQETSTLTVNYKKITAQEAKAVIDGGNTVILDVRTQGEYEEGHLEGAILLPNTEIKGKAVEVLPDKNATILVYCRSGNRSAQATRALLEMGYSKVYDFGGINDWPYETVK